MVAGVIFMNVHKLNLNEIRGFGRKKPLLAAIYLMGALGIGGVPLFSGYVSKTLLHESIVEYIHGLEGGSFVSAFFLATDLKIIEWIFLISGGLTIAYMCKLFIAVFVEENADSKVQQRYDDMKKYMNPGSTVALTVSAIVIPIMGFFPHQTMDRLADMAQGFMGVTQFDHEVQYLTWTNLKGSLISIVIGVLVYLVIVRGWMMKKKENGAKVYVNKWSRYLDLEDMIYRPVLLHILPGICGVICVILDNVTDVFAKFIPIAGNAQAGFFDVITDGLIVFLRKTIYKDSPQTGEMEEGNALTHAFGVFLNKWEAFLNRILWRKHPHDKDYVHIFALKYSSFKENTAFISRSLSYGLILFCLGLCATLIYLLVSALR